MMDWESLRDTALHCTACKLCQGRHHVVFGVGNPKAEIMFIGEGPGQHEDEQGEPFVGRSGQLMDKMLHYIDLDRSRNIYIANIVKCRPPQNRDPEQEEIAAGNGALQGALEAILQKGAAARGPAGKLEVAVIDGTDLDGDAAAVQKLLIPSVAGHTAYHGKILTFQMK